MATSPPPPPPGSHHVHPPSAQGNGLAVAGFVLAVIGIALCWVPIVNNISLVLAVVGVVLAAVGWFRVRRGGAHRGLAIAGVVLAVATIALTLTFQAIYVDAVDDAFDELERDLGAPTSTTVR